MQFVNIQLKEADVQASDPSKFRQENLKAYEGNSSQLYQKYDFKATRSFIQMRSSSENGLRLSAKSGTALEKLKNIE